MSTKIPKTKPPLSPKMNTSFWKIWTDIALYTPELHTYIKDQRNLLHEIVRNNHYVNIIEAGCGNGTFLFPTVFQLGLNYIGIDKEQQAVVQLNKTITHLQYSSDLRAIWADMQNFSDVVNQYNIPSENSLVVFPFNALGVMDNPASILAQISDSGLDVLIFTYATTDRAQSIRHDYYQQLQFSNVTIQRDLQDSVVFRSEEGLTSYAYAPHLIMSWLQATYPPNIQQIQFSELGIAFLAQRPGNA
jgi:hypothetical protein